MSEPRDGAPDDDFILDDDDASALAARPITTDDLDAVLARRASPRRRLLQLSVIVVPVLVVASLILRSTLPPAPPSTTFVPAPTWTPPPVPITLVSNVSFGTVSLNGRRLSGPPPQNIKLVSGNNLITLTAPPFPTQSCVIHGPLVYSGGQAIVRSDSTCSINTEGDGSNYPSHIYIMLMLSGDGLPPDLLASARALVSTTLGIASPLTATVPAGDYYATGIGNQGIPIASRASTPLTATVTQTLVDSTAIGSGSAGPSNPVPYECASALCAGGYDPLQPLPKGVWVVNVQTILHWYFTAPSGLLVGSLQVAAPQPYVLALIYNPDTGWQMGGPLPYSFGPGQGPPLLCQLGMNLLGQALSSQNQGGYGINETHSAPDGMRGCSFQLVNHDGSIAGTFIWRFGALLAAEPKAHALRPDVPVAPPQEVAAVGA